MEQINAMLALPVYTQGERPRGGAGEAAYWLPLLGLYSGTRLEELGGLMVADVALEDGVHYLRIDDNAARRVKTKSSRRRVPLHPVWIELGFLRYVERLRAAGRPVCSH